MQSGNPSNRSLFVPASLFILAYFFLFSYEGLNAHLTFDDGMNIIAMHHHWEVSIWRNILEVLKVFTTANRPLGALFYRPMYRLFGFDPYPYRVAAYLFLVFNIILAHRFARTVGATREAAALSTLLFCYNASMIDLYYSTGTIYDLLCFPLFFGALLLYIKDRSKGELRGKTMAWIMLLFLAALDAKEMAALLPADLLFYELLFRFNDLRSPDPRAKATLRRVAAFIALTGVISAIFLKVKVTDMSNNQLYHPTYSLSFILTGMGHYFEQYFYCEPNTFGAMTTALTIATFLGLGAAFRNRVAVFGTLLFVAGLLPVAIIPPRSGYAAYVAFPGLTVALGAILDSARVALLRITRKEHLQRVTTIGLFLFIAIYSIKSFAHIRKILMVNYLWTHHRMVGMFDAFKRQFPELPPGARILILDDPWGPDWGPMFLTRLMYHDRAIWVDRLKNPEKPGERDTYDLLLTYKSSYVVMEPAKLFGFKMNWEMRARTTKPGELVVTTPSEGRAPRNLDFSPTAVRTGMPVVVTIPGVSNVKIDGIYRILANGKSTTTVAKDWCDVDANGRCTFAAPPAGQVGILVVDWIRRPNERWILTNGVLTVVE